MAEEKKDYWGGQIERLLESGYDNTGSLNPNKGKRSDNHPDYQGLLKFPIKIESVDRVMIIKISGWVKLKTDGSKWISMKAEVVKVVKERDGNAKETDCRPTEA